MNPSSFDKSNSHSEAVHLDPSLTSKLQQPLPQFQAKASKKPCLSVLRSSVSMVNDLEPRLKQANPSLNLKNGHFVERVLAFSLSATCIIDLKTDVEKQNQQTVQVNHFLTSLKSEPLCNFLAKLIMQKRKNWVKSQNNEQAIQIDHKQIKKKFPYQSYQFLPKQKSSVFSFQSQNKTSKNDVKNLLSEDQLDYKNHEQLRNQTNFNQDSIIPEQNNILQLSDKFQEFIEVEIFSMRINIYHNDVLAVASLTKAPNPHKIAQNMLTRYFFSQFWCELTKKQLIDFMTEDLNYKTFQANFSSNLAKSKSQQNSPTKSKPQSNLIPLNLDSDGMVRLTAEGHSLLQELQTADNTYELSFLSGQFANSNINQLEQNALSRYNNEISGVKLDKSKVNQQQNSPPPILNSINQRDNNTTCQRQQMLRIFRTYNKLNLNTCLGSYTRIFNDVFSKQKPSTNQKYHLTQVLVLELLKKNSKTHQSNLSGNLLRQDKNLQNLDSYTLNIPHSYNFACGTVRACSYTNSKEFQNFLKQAMLYTSYKDRLQGLTVAELQRRATNKSQNTQASVFHNNFGQNFNCQEQQPQNGEEYFFSNVLLKVYQIPMIFSQSNQGVQKAQEKNLVSQDNICCIALLFEKQTRKRSYAKTTNQYNRLRKQIEYNERGLTRFEEEGVHFRDQRIRRFTNYFNTLFNQQKLVPFTQFIENRQIQQLKRIVQKRLNDPSGADSEEEKETSKINKPSNNRKQFKRQTTLLVKNERGFNQQTIKEESKILSESSTSDKRIKELPHPNQEPSSKPVSSQFKQNYLYVQSSSNNGPQAVVKASNSDQDQKLSPNWKMMMQNKNNLKLGQTRTNEFGLKLNKQLSSSFIHNSSQIGLQSQSNLSVIDQKEPFFFEMSKRKRSQVLPMQPQSPTFALPLNNQNDIDQKTQRASQQDQQFSQRNLLQVNDYNQYEYQHEQDVGSSQAVLSKMVLKPSNQAKSGATTFGQHKNSNQSIASMLNGFQRHISPIVQRLGRQRQEDDESLSFNLSKDFIGLSMLKSHGNAKGFNSSMNQDNNYFGTRSLSYLQNQNVYDRQIIEDANEAAMVDTSESNDSNSGHGSEDDQQNKNKSTGKQQKDPIMKSKNQQQVQKQTQFAVSKAKATIKIGPQKPVYNETTEESLESSQNDSRLNLLKPKPNDQLNAQTKQKQTLTLENKLQSFGAQQNKSNLNQQKQEQQALSSKQQQNQNQQTTKYRKDLLMKQQQSESSFTSSSVAVSDQKSSINNKAKVNQLKMEVKFEEVKKDQQESSWHSKSDYDSQSCHTN